MTEDKEGRKERECITALAEVLYRYLRRNEIDVDMEDWHALPPYEVEYYRSCIETLFDEPEAATLHDLRSNTPVTTR